MDNAVEFHAAESVLLNAEVSAKSIRISLENIEREIGILTVVEGNLVDNINTLRRKDIVPLADHYRKARADLNLAITRRSILRVDRETHLRALERAEKVLEQARERYALALDRMRNPPNNIIQGNFGRKNGQK